MQKLKSLDSVEAGMASTDAGSFVGYASRFLNIDRDGDIILPGAYSKSINQFIDEGGVVLANHENKTSSVIGTLKNAMEDRSGLMVEVAFSATKTAQDVRQLMLEKAVSKMSIRFVAAKPEKLTEKQIKELWTNYGYQPSAQQQAAAKYGANLIKSIPEIYEVSVVPIPANMGAGILSVKGANNTPELSTVSGCEHPRPDLLALLQRCRAADSVLLSRSKR
jgi:HK97 family phage prohead protease